MGLSIYYKGRFNKDASLQDMIEEVKDVAEIYNWKYHIFETEFNPADFNSSSYNDKIFGISYSPPKSESIDITFLSNGIMCSPVSLQYFGKDKSEDLLINIFSKTQYAGVEAHKIIIDLFRYLSKKYFSEFELTDESCYWETGDEAVMRQTFKKYDDMMNIFAGGLENIPINENECIEDYVKRVAEILKFKMP